MKSYLITGATGYIGSSLIRFLLNNAHKKGENADIDSDIRIFAPVRDLHKASRMFPEGVEFFQTDLCDRQCAGQLLEAVGSADYIIHCASVTASAQMISHPVEVTESIVNMTQNILEFARHSRIRSAVYLSSMEVYGNIVCPDGHRITENEVCRGEVEILSARSCYPLGKRMSENICYAYFKEYNVPVKIARLAQTFGEGVLPSDRRVFSQFAAAVREGRDIVLHTMGNSMGNYCGIHDALSGVMMILEKGENGEAYNVVNEASTMTIRQMAGLVAEKLAGGRIKVVCRIAEKDRYGYAADTALCLSGEKLMSLGWRPKESLEDMYRQLI